MKRVIAEDRFDCIDRQGKRFRAVVRIGEPISHPREGTLAGDASCPLSMEPFFRERAIESDDRFQALCVAIEKVRRVLQSFVADGGRVYFAGSGAPIDLDDPSFSSLPDLRELRQLGRRKRRGRQRRSG